MPAPETGAASDLTLLEETLRAAGQIARRYFQGSYKSWDKAKGQPVTEADLAIDRFLQETLTAARPGYGWLSEESDAAPASGDSGRTFVVDPIDGTLAFIKGKPHFTICTAVVEDGRPSVGVVYNPMTDECFSARLGGGARRNGNPISVRTQAEIAGCRMLATKTIFLHPSWNELPNMPWPEMTVETRSSIAYRMALVADGTFDAMLALSAKHDWDLAAGDIIAHEAGGYVTNHRGEVLRYNGAKPIQPSVVCAGPILHKRLVDRLFHLELPDH